MKYHLAEACSNTFVLFDCLSAPKADETLLTTAHHCLEQEKRDDALILTGGRYEDGIFHAKMNVLGLDGVLGEFCGNGARACAAYLWKMLPSFQKMALSTDFGLHTLKRYEENTYSIQLPPARFELNKKFINDPEQFTKKYGFCRYVEVIEPHLVIEEKMSDSELSALGQRLNQDRDIFPLGINVNAWHIVNESALFVKTYERGVQRLTQSCGTGSMSCASACRAEGKFTVSTPGGC